MSKQYVFKKEIPGIESEEQYFLIDVLDNGHVSLKVKEAGWSDTWSLPLALTDCYGNVVK